MDDMMIAPSDADFEPLEQQVKSDPLVLASVAA